MVLSPVSNRDWTDPAWNISTPDPETNVLTSLRLKNERGRGCHKVVDSQLKEFFAAMVTNIVSKLSDSEGAKIDLSTISTSFELTDVYVTINQCTVSPARAYCIIVCAPFSPQVCVFHRLSSGIQAIVLMPLSIKR